MDANSRTFVVLSHMLPGSLRPIQLPNVDQTRFLDECEQSAIAIQDRLLHQMTSYSDVWDDQFEIQSRSRAIESIPDCGRKQAVSGRLEFVSDFLKRMLTRTGEAFEFLLPFGIGVGDVERYSSNALGVLKRKMLEYRKYLGATRNRSFDLLSDHIAQGGRSKFPASPN